MLRINGVIINGGDDLPKAPEPIYVTRRAATTGSAESGFGPFLGRETKNRFHRPTCKYIRRFLKWPGTIRFESHAEAVEAGRKPCQTCKA
jgi:hypothetical protein